MPDPTPHSRRLLFLAGLILLLALALRLAGLTAWSLHPDEYHTWTETFRPAAHGSLRAMLPLNYALFGLVLDPAAPSALALRIVPLLAGVLSVALLMAAAWRQWGAHCGLLSGVLLAVSPWHILFSQYGRFYAGAFLLVAAALFALLEWMRDGRARWAATAAVAGAAAAYVHTYTVLPVGAALLYVLLGFVAPAWRAAGWTARGAGLLVGLTALGWLPMLLTLPGAAGDWSAANTWGYTPLHTLLGLLNNLTLPVAGVAALGGAVALARGDAAGRLMLVVGGVTALGVVVASGVVSARHDYAFASAAAFYLLAAYAIDACGGRWRGDRWVLLLLVVALQAPNIVSYYACGNRFPYREAFEWVEAHAAPGEPVVSEAAALGTYYGLSQTQSRSLRAWLAGEALQTRTGYWLMLTVGRGGLAPDMSEWLRTHGAPRWRIRPRRFDYYEHEIQVWYVAAESLSSPE